MNQLKIYNSLTREKEVFNPIHPPYVGMYLCGPTVSGESHLGHVRPAVTFDVLNRYLKYLGYKVRYVRNITDAGHFEEEGRESEDKVAIKAKLEQIEPMELVTKYTNLYHDAMERLNVLRPSIEPTATGHIIEQINMIEDILSKGFAYVVNGSVYFDVAKYAKENDYGRLSGRKIEEMIAGSRELEGQEEKRHPADFALWKKAPQEHLMRWKSPWGEGFPGWHIECSAMSMKALGGTFDIHVGGVDLIFPHHENEIAQSEGATGQEFVKYWVHAEFLMVEGEKMSKSKGNYFTFRDLVDQGYSPRAIRYLLLSAPHHRQLNLTMDGLRGAEHTTTRLNDFRLRLTEITRQGERSPAVLELVERSMKQFEESLDDDLNTAEALAAIHEFVRETNSMMTSAGLTVADRDLLTSAVDRFDSVFNVFGEARREMLDAEIDALIEERRAARAARNFSRADEIRQQLLGRGILLEDTKEGVRWRRQ